MAEGRYFSEREGHVVPRSREDLSEEFWRGVVALMRRLLNDGSLAERFPEPCFEAPFPVDADRDAIGFALQAEVPGFPWPLDPETKPDDLTVLDGLEFFARHVSTVTRRVHHSYGRHDHFTDFDRAQGIELLTRDVNRMLRRCGHPYELIQADGEIEVRRIGSVVLEVELQGELRSGEEELDRLIAVAVSEFHDPDPDVRRQALEHLWDAWERLKTIRDADKRVGIARLLEASVGSEQLRERMNVEGQELTDIGNSFRIRHSEIDRHPISSALDIDYLFHRMYALLVRLIRGSDRGGA
jgi:hypothetical protein